MTAYKNQTGIILRGGGSSGDAFTGCEDVLIIGRSYKTASVNPKDCGLAFRSCKNVRVLDCDFAGLSRGIVFYLTDGFNASGNRVTGQTIDGINVAQSWRGLVADNLFTDPDTGEAHPDAIQMWSRPDYKPTSDIVIARNKVVGQMTQGITAFNHVRPQPPGFKLWTGEVLAAQRDVDDGGFDRISILDNDITVGMPQALALGSARDSSALRNHVRTWPGATWRASINLIGPGIVHYGNTADAAAGKPAWADAPC